LQQVESHVQRQEGRAQTNWSISQIMAVVFGLVALLEFVLRSSGVVK
jgi:hypothetical protein